MMDVYKMPNELLMAYSAVVKAVSPDNNGMTLRIDVQRYAAADTARGELE